MQNKSCVFLTLMGEWEHDGLYKSEASMALSQQVFHAFANYTHNRCYTVFSINDHCNCLENISRWAKAQHNILYPNLIDLYMFYLPSYLIFHVLVVSAWVHPGFLPQPRDMHVRLNGKTKLSVQLSMSVNGLVQKKNIERKCFHFQYTKRSQLHG